jgi:hypothetical protein
MKSYICSTVILSSVLVAAGSLAATRDTQPPTDTIVVGAGNDLQCRLEKGLRITKSGEPSTHSARHPCFRFCCTPALLSNADGGANSSGSSYGDDQTAPA